MHQSSAAQKRYEKESDSIFIQTILPTKLLINMQQHFSVLLQLQKDS